MWIMGLKAGVNNYCPIFPYYDHYAIKLVLLNFNCVFQENK